RINEVVVVILVEVQININFIANLLEVVSNSELVVNRRWTVAVFHIANRIAVEEELITSLSDQPGHIAACIFLTHAVQSIASKNHRVAAKAHLTLAAEFIIGDRKTHRIAMTIDFTRYHRHNLYFILAFTLSNQRLFTLNHGRREPEWRVIARGIKEVIRTVG